MKNTLTVRKKLISEDVIKVLQSQEGFAYIDVTDSNSNWIINIYPNKETIERYKKVVYGVIDNTNLTNEHTDIIVEGVIISILSVLYRSIFDLIMKEISNTYIRDNIIPSKEMQEYARKISSMLNPGTSSS